MTYQSFLNVTAVLLVILGGAACALKEQQQVYCHNWSELERKNLVAADKKLTADDPLHPLIKDYIRVCSSLEQ